MKKIAAEEARAAADEKAQLAKQEKARLAAEGAKLAEIAKAAAASKAAEEARIAAEKAKQIEQEKVAAAEKARIAQQENARLGAENAKQVEQEKATAGGQAQPTAQTEADADANKHLLAAISPTDKPEQTSVDLTRALQAELRRVGWDPGAVDGSWGTASQEALHLFNKHTGSKLDAKTASIDALDAVKAKAGRICPLVCGKGYKAAATIA